MARQASAVTIPPWGSGRRLQDPSIVPWYRPGPSAAGTTRVASVKGSVTVAPWRAAGTVSTGARVGRARVVEARVNRARADRGSGQVLADLRASAYAACRSARGLGHPGPGGQEHRPAGRVGLRRLRQDLGGQPGGGGLRRGDLVHEVGVRRLRRRRVDAPGLRRGRAAVIDGSSPAANPSTEVSSSAAVVRKVCGVTT